MLAAARMKISCKSWKQHSDDAIDASSALQANMQASSKVRCLLALRTVRTAQRSVLQGIRQFLQHNASSIVSSEPHLHKAPPLHALCLLAQELHSYQAWLIAELLDPIQWARAEATAFPQMMDGLAVGELDTHGCRSALPHFLASASDLW